MARRVKKEHTAELYEAIVKINDPKECFYFFQDLCSDSELLAMEQRFQVAELLEAGNTYLDIQDSTNSSTATISRVGRALSQGNGLLKRLLPGGNSSGDELS